MALNNSEREAYMQERNKCVGILERFAKAKLEDDMKSDAERNVYAQSSLLSKDEQKQHKAAFEQKLAEMRSDPNDTKLRAYSEMVSKQQQMNKLSEYELMQGGCIKTTNNVSMVVLHAYCPECGEELVATSPKMFNPFTKESIAEHTCKKCGKVYNLENAYPRFAIIDTNGNEIKAYGM